MHMIFRIMILFLICSLFIILHAAYRSARTVAQIEPIVQRHVGFGVSADVYAPERSFLGGILPQKRNPRIESGIAGGSAVIISGIVEAPSLNEHVEPEIGRQRRYGRSGGIGIP